MSRKHGQNGAKAYLSNESRGVQRCSNMNDEKISQDRKLLQDSLRSFHNRLIATVLWKWQGRHASEDGLQSKVEELEKRWKQKLEARVGPLSDDDSESIKPLENKFSGLDAFQISQPAKCSSNELIYFSPQFSSSSINLSEKAFGKPKSTIKLQSFSKPQQSTVNKSKKISNSSSILSTYSAVPNSMSSLEPPLKRQKLVYHPEKHSTISDQQPPNPLIFKIEATLIGTVLLQGMKMYVHIPSVQKLVGSNSSSWTNLPKVSSARIVHITRENIQTSTKIVSRTKLLLRLQNSGEELLLPWPTYALHANKSELERNILALSNAEIETAAINMSNNRQESVVEHRSIAYPSVISSTLPSYGQGWIETELDASIPIPSNSNYHHNEDIEKIPTSEGHFFAEQLLAEVGDLSWCDIPAFTEMDDDSICNEMDPDPTIDLGKKLEKKNSSLSNQLPTRLESTKALLVSGEIVDQTILEDIERYFELRRTHKPIFQVQPSPSMATSSISTLLNSHHTIDDENISSVYLHPEDDPLSVLPTPDMTFIGKAAKVVSGESELYLVLKDVYVHCEDVSMQDMIIPHISVRLISAHLFGK